MIGQPAANEKITTPEITTPSAEPLEVTTQQEQQTPQSPNLSKMSLLVGALALLVVLGIALYSRNMSSVTPIPLTGLQTDGLACDTDAQICSDGTAVGRTGPNCEFAACPDDSTPADSLEMRSISQPDWTLDIPQNWKYLECPDNLFVMSPNYSEDMPNSSCDFGVTGEVAVTRSEEDRATVLQRDLDEEQQSMVTILMGGGKQAILRKTIEVDVFGAEKAYTRAYVDHNGFTYTFTLSDQDYLIPFRQMLLTVEFK